MSGVNIEYKGESIATIPDTGLKTIKTQGKYCEGDILVEYEAPPAPQPTLITKQITENGTYTAADDNADGYSEVTVDIQPYYNSQGTMYFADMVIPDTVTTIKARAYQGCVNLRTLKIAGTVKSIRSYAFQTCPITSLVLTYGIDTFEEFVFASHKCSTVFIPSSVKNIGAYSFYTEIANQVYDLSAFIDPNNIPTLQPNAFSLKRIASFLVANQEMLDAFSAATNWSIYADRFQIKGATP